MNKDQTYKLCGYIFFAFWLLYTSLLFLGGVYEGVLWFCNLSVLFLAIACFERSARLMYFVISLGILFQTPWIVDWTLYLTTGFSLFDMQSYYGDKQLFFMILTFIRHTLTVPASLILVYFLTPAKLNKKHFVLYSITIVVIVAGSYSMGFLKNVNCSHYFCASAIHNYVPANLGYTFVATSIILLSVSALAYGLSRLHASLRN